MIYYISRKLLNINIEEAIHSNKHIYRVYNRNINGPYSQPALPHQQSNNNLRYRNKYN